MTARLYRSPLRRRGGPGVAVAPYPTVAFELDQVCEHALLRQFHQVPRQSPVDARHDRFRRAVAVPHRVEHLLLALMPMVDVLLQHPYWVVDHRSVRGVEARR